MTRALALSSTALVAAVVAATPARAAFTFAGAWGSQGSGNGQFQELDGVAVDRAGNVYVADTRNRRIQRFTADGAFLTAWGAPGQFNAPADVAAAADGTVYVADTGTHRIQRFTRDGLEVSAPWGGPGSLDGQFSGPLGVAGAPDGTVYVSDGGNDRIQRFLADGTFLASFGGSGAGNGRLSAPRGIAVGPEGTVYVVDAGNTRVQAYTPEGTFITAWGSNGTGNGQFTREVRGVAATAAGVYVADPGSRSVQRFTSGGAFLERLDGPASGDGDFATPLRVAGAETGHLYVSQGTARMGRYTQQADGPPDFDTLPPPETGATANAAPVRGTVRIRRPGRPRFEQLDRAAQIPIGSLIDVRRGEIVLRTTSGGGRTQDGRFFGGLFRLVQTRAARPVTELRLEGGNVRRACRRFRVQARVARRGKIRRLWGNGTGRFRTRGRYGAASLRGTEWLTEDYCDGTLFRVRSGAVTVRDFVARRSIVVRPGRSYFARANPRHR